MRLPQLNSRDLGRPRYRARNPVLEGRMYVLRQPLYDFYGAVVGTLLTRQVLFNIQQGQQYTPAGGAALTKSDWHTNMDLPGLLQSPRKFFAKGISLALRSDTFIADAHRFLYDTLLDFQISGRSYGKLAAHRFPQSGGLSGGSAAIVSNGWATEDNQYITFGESGEVIEQQQSLAVVLDPTRVVDAGALATFTTTAAAAGGTGINAFVYLDGLLHREVG